MSGKQGPIDPETTRIVNEQQELEKKKKVEKLNICLGFLAGIVFTVSIAIIAWCVFSPSNTSTASTEPKAAVVEVKPEEPKPIRTASCPVISVDVVSRYTDIQINCQGKIIKIDDPKMLEKYFLGLIVEDKKPNFVCETFLERGYENTKCKLPE